MKPCDRALHVARGLDGVREVGSNAGTWVGRFLASVGLGTGFSWCAAFVYFCETTAGIALGSLPAKRKAAAVSNWYLWANKQGRIRACAKRGRLFYWLDGGQGHIGMCLSDGEAFKTLEGNTNKAGSREGDGVYDRIRTLNMLKSHELYGFIDLSDLG
jgi:hypothetical protein